MGLLIGDDDTVMVVDDSDDIRELMCMMLRGMGYRVVEAANGEEAVDLSLLFHPALILMDLSMPVLDGYEALNLLRANPSTSSVPVVALTAHALTADRDNILGAGFDGYIAKPAEPRAVVAEVERRIGPASADG